VPGPESGSPGLVLGPSIGDLALQSLVIFTIVISGMNPIASLKQSADLKYPR